MNGMSSEVQLGRQMGVRMDGWEREIYSIIYNGRAALL